MPFEWAVVFVVFVVICVIVSAVLAGPSPRTRDSVQLGLPPREITGQADLPDGNHESNQLQLPRYEASQRQRIGPSTAASAAKTTGLVGAGEGAEGKSNFQTPSSPDHTGDRNAATLYDEDPETVVYGQDPSNESDDNRRWSLGEQQRLLHCYGDNEDWDIIDLARHFSTTIRSVVITLMFLLLGPLGPIEDRHCPKWRQPWTQKAVDEVHDLFRAGASLPAIARASGRDQLSVAFRLFRDRLPEVHGVTDDFLSM